ncbi:NAD(P)/FAD-dependent oxidoreductase [Seminibacterium arietis]|uniref:NAD(P)/FAD-dependent oxidoreductase n=1 Tax=Seminibacterium arietis TaxID=1173502 RepID=A0ABW3I7W8_9PAST
MTTSNFCEVIIIGAGASGLFCAFQLAKKGKQVAVFDNGKQIARKVRISGGGFCNFTNLDVNASHYLSQNPHFVKSALARFNQWDFISLISQHNITYHEKECGQLFCDNGSQQIVNLLAHECEQYNAAIYLRQHVDKIELLEKQKFSLLINKKIWHCQHLIVATGGLSMPALGATPLGYQIAENFGLNVVPPRAVLVPFTWRENDKFYTALSGIALPVAVTAKCGKSFQGNLLFTHRGISGPAVLQISSYWQPNESIEIDLLPDQNIIETLQKFQQKSPKIHLKTAISKFLPTKLVEIWLQKQFIQDGTLANISKVKLENLSNLIHHWQFYPNGTEGYRTAEVTLGGVDTNEISSKTMESKKVRGLYFIGEVVDVTGQLGGYNFQWAWSSAFACAEGIVNGY